MIFLMSDFLWGVGANVRGGIYSSVHGLIGGKISFLSLILLQKGLGAIILQILVFWASLIGFNSFLLCSLSFHLIVSLGLFETTIWKTCLICRFSNIYNRFSLDSRVSCNILFHIQMNKRQFHCLSGSSLFVWRGSFVALNLGRYIRLGASVLGGVKSLVLLNQRRNILGLVGTDVMCSIQSLIRSCVSWDSMVGSSVFGQGCIFGFEHQSSLVRLSSQIQLGFDIDVRGVVCCFLFYDRLWFNFNFLLFRHIHVNIFFMLKV